MKNESERKKTNTKEKKENNSSGKKSNQSNIISQKDLNKTNFSDTIKILNLLKSYPPTGTSTSFIIDNKQDINNVNINNIENNAINNSNSNEIDNLSYEEIKAICLNIFLIYAQPINGQFYLSLRSTFRILKELEIISQNCLSYVDIEILHQQVNRKGDKLNSQQFLDLLAKICCLLDDSFYKDKKSSFIKLIKKYILPYLNKYKKGNYSTKFNKDEAFNLSMNLNFKNLILVDFHLDQDSFNILMSIVEGIKIIYEVYFSTSELTADKNIKNIHDKSFDIFIKFIKDFDILPYLINRRLAELYWYLIISEDLNNLYKISEGKNYFKSFLENKEYDLGKIYTFKKFFLLLSHISFYFYYPIKSKTKAQKLLYVIEKIYKSRGYQNMPNVYCKTFNKKYSIIPPVNIVQKITKNVIEKKEESKSRNKEEMLQKYTELGNDTFETFENYLEQLKTIFDIYCKIGDRIHYGRISFSNFHKLLFDGDLLLINDKIKQKSNKDEISKEDENEKENNNIIIDSNNLGKSKPTELSNLNKETYNNLNELNNSNIIKRKLKLTDLNIIISIICGRQNLPKYHSNFSQEKEPNTSFKKNIILNSDFLNANIDQSYSMDFILFLKSLVLIAGKLYPNENNDLNESMKLFLNNDMETFISKLNKKCLSLYPYNEKFNNLFKLISSKEEMIQLMDDIAPFINTYFNCYALNCEQNIKKMDLKLFINIFKEFEIFPEWINLVNLTDIFYTQIYREKNEKNIFRCDEKIDFIQFLECFILVGLTMNSGNDLDMVDKILFLIDKMFSENYGKIVKIIRSTPSLKEEYVYFEKILREKYPSYYERKYSNAGYRYDNKFYWIYEKNYANDKFTQQIDFGELFDRENVKFEDVFEDINNNTEEKKEENEHENNNNNEEINEIKEV